MILIAISPKRYMEGNEHVKRGLMSLIISEKAN